MKAELIEVMETGNTLVEGVTCYPNGKEARETFGESDEKRSKRPASATHGLKLMPINPRNRAI